MTRILQTRNNPLDYGDDRDENVDAGFLKLLVCAELECSTHILTLHRIIA